MSLGLQAAGSGQSKTAGTTLGFFLNLGGINKGDMVVVAVALDNTATVDGASSTVSAVSDGLGNTYTKIIEQTNTVGGAAGDGACLAVWYCPSASVAGVPSFTVTHASLTARGAIVVTFSSPNLNGGTADPTTANSRGDGLDPASFSLTPAGGNKEYLWFYALAVEGPTGETDTADAANGWAQLDYVGTSGGSAVTNQAVVAGWQVATAASKTADWGHTARDHQQVLIAFTENGSVFPRKPKTEPLPLIPRGRSM